MEGFQPAEEHLSWTDEMEFTASEFTLSDAPLRYYLTNVKLSVLEQVFKLVEDIPGSASWGYDAIFQRDIDDERVEEELLKKYLLNPNKSKFFNPLTIALLPFDARDNKILDQYPPARVEIQEQRQEGRMKKEFIVDGIEVQSLEGSTIGKLRWDRDKIVGVAIDGQHRLSALMKYAGHPDQPAGIDPTKAKIPIVLLVLDKGAKSALTQVREIFVDINKNAEPVTLGRRILLDDRDPIAVLTRDLIADESNEKGLRYELVDWKRETARPEGEVQITTLVVLYEIVRRLLGTRVTQFESELGLNAALTSKGFSRVSATEMGLDDLSDKQISVALERFRLRYKEVILHIFQNLSPFRAFIQELAVHVDGGDEKSQAFKEYIFKPPKKRKEFRSEISRRGLAPAEVIEAPLSSLQRIKDTQKGAELLFLSIGQRGLFSWFHTLRKIYRDCGFDDLVQISKEYRTDLNLLVA
jgi:DGQHR domain-containing protein